MFLHELKASVDLLTSVVGDISPKQVSHLYVKFRPGAKGLKLINRWFEGTGNEIRPNSDGFVQFPMPWVVSWVTEGLLAEDLADLSLVDD